MPPRQPRLIDNGYLAYLRRQPCACGCGKGPPSDAAHIRIGSLAYDKPPTGMGEKPVEDAQARYGYKVEGVILAGNTRLNIATTSRQKFEDRKVRIPAGNPALRADLHKLKRVQGDTGAPRLVADRDGDGHADRAWAAFLGMAGATPEPGLLGYYQRLLAAQEAGKAAAKPVI